MELLFDHESNLNSPDEKKNAVKRKMAWRILIFFFTIFLFLLIFIGNDVGSIYSYSASLAISVIGIVYLFITKNPNPLFSVGSFLGCLIAQFSTWFVIGASHYVDFIWIIICSVVAFLGANRKYATVLLVANAIGIGYYIFFVQNEHFMYIQQLGPLPLTSNYLEMVLAIFILGYIMYEFMGFQENWEKAYRETNVHLQSKNKTIIVQNDQNIILLKEIHHRVKNNLQIIVSLLRLQKHELDNEAAKTQFQEAINRVIVMSSIHQKLYRQDDFTHINLPLHLEDLIQEVKSLFEHNQNVFIAVESKVKYVDLKTMVPLGLLINELLSNSFKYAFINREKGLIEVSIYPRNEGFTLHYKDNGIWTGEDSNGGFGLELIEVFTNQLNGTRTFTTNTEGTCYTFDLEYADQEVVGELK